MNDLLIKIIREYPNIEILFFHDGVKQKLNREELKITNIKVETLTHYDNRWLNYEACKERITYKYYYYVEPEDVDDLVNKRLDSLEFKDYICVYLD